MGGQDLGVMDPPVLRWDDRRGLSLPNPAEGGHGQSQDGGSPDALLRGVIDESGARTFGIEPATSIGARIGAAWRSGESELAVL